MDNSGDIRILESFNISKDEYLSYNQDIRLAILRYYWDLKMNEQHSFKKENIKTKVLSIIKR